MSDSADFARLGEMEITCAGDIFAQCEFIRERASNAGLILLTWAMDVEYALASVPVLEAGGWHGIGADNPAKRAHRVAQHAHRGAESMRTVAESVAKFPPAYRKGFNDVIQQRRGRRTFDPRAGL